jgi:hypothetical protein
MALDRVICWKGTRPSQEQIQHYLEDFFGGFATSIEWRVDRWFVFLVGAPTYAFRRQPDIAPHMIEARALDAVNDDGTSRPRWIEVWPSWECLYVMTRMTDEATNSLAKGLAERFAQFWKGDLEEG